MHKIIVFHDLCAGHFTADELGTNPYAKRKRPHVVRVVGGTILQPIEGLLQVAEILTWLQENIIHHTLTGWRYIEHKNDEGGLYYRLCFTILSIHDENIIHQN